MSFEALQRRAAAGHLSAPVLARELPAHLIVFDVLQADGRELLQAPYVERRARLEQLFTDHDLHASWARCPETDDPATGQEWLTSWTRVPGVEGLIIRGTEQHYLRGARVLYKVRRDTTEAIIGAITGSLQHPQTLILGRYDDTGHLRLVGRSTPLRKDAARQLAERLTPAAPGHPWEGVRFHVVMGIQQDARRDPGRAGPGRRDRGRHRSGTRRMAPPRPLRAAAPGRDGRGRARVRPGRTAGRRVISQIARLRPARPRGRKAGQGRAACMGSSRFAFRLEFGRTVSGGLGAADGGRRRGAR
ncbi:ATP-dependent DNA ligase [Streptomyces sp. NPDC014776]|uniref:ATP-dependent DNA ligase n=1 Tax=unclassified Streptomyces TaxID=2593676 RepID=UPI0036F4FE4D